MPRTKTKTYTVQIEASITVYTLIEVTATTEDEAREKAEEQFRDYVGIDFRACDGNDDVARELRFNSTFDVGDVETEVENNQQPDYTKLPFKD